MAALDGEHKRISSEGANPYGGCLDGLSECNIILSSETCSIIGNKPVAELHHWMHGGVS